MPNGSAWRRAGIVGRAVADVVGSEVYEQVAGNLQRALAGERITYEYRMPRAGQTAYAHSTLVPEIGSDGQTLGAFVFAHDITEQKRMQAALLQAQKMEAIGSLTGGWRMTSTICSPSSSATSPRSKNSAAATRPSAILSHPRCNRPAAGCSDPAAAHLFPATAAGTAGGGHRPLAGRSGPPYPPLPTGQHHPDQPRQQHRGVRPVPALADPALLESALLNFALNARDAMPGGGCLTVSAETVELPADARKPPSSTSPPGHYVSIAVADDGCGMDAQTLAHACEPFFHHQTSGPGQRPGDSPWHRGSCASRAAACASAAQPERGTQVEIVLPQTAPPLAAAPPLASPAPAANGALVLLVEDDNEVRRVVRQQLIELGHPVIEAENAEQALAMVEQISDIAIVVSDVLMPGSLNGRQLSERIRHNRPQMRIVLVSGYADDAPRPGDPPVLAKPFTRQDLARALARTEQESDA